MAGPHDEEFVVVEPGDMLDERAFWDAGPGLSRAPRRRPGPRRPRRGAGARGALPARPCRRAPSAAPTWCSSRSCTSAATCSTSGWRSRRRRCRSASSPRLQAAVDELSLSAVLGLPCARGEALLNAVAVLRPRRAGVVRRARPTSSRSRSSGSRRATDLWTGRARGLAVRRVVVCYELGFPEIARVLALRGARLLLAPAAFGAARAHIWRAATVCPGPRERLLPGGREPRGTGSARRLPRATAASSTRAVP